jgi:hypothetical protein
MATSPNFSWPEPDNTDLVKNGALAIRTAINAIDTSMVDLKGGTTGQVLSKTSNTDMDFTWVTDAAGDITGVTAGTGISGGGTSGTVTVTNSMATAIDAKGDLIGGTGADTFARLAVGTDGQVLTADSAEATGLKWASAASGGMTLLSTTTLSGTSTSISVTPTGYNNLEIYVSGVNCASDYILTMRVNSDTTAANYRNSWQADIGYALDQGRTSSTVGSLINGVPGINGAESSDTNNSSYTVLSAPNSSVAKNIFTISSFLNDSAYRSSVTSQCSYVTTSAISSLQFISTQSLTAGTVLIYGVK